MLLHPSTPGSRAIGLLAGLLCLIIYLAGASPVIYWRDSVEFAMIGHNLDIGHPAGSPLFTMAAKLADLIPIGSIAFRAVLPGIIAAFLCAVLLFRILSRLAEHAGLKRPAGSLAALFGVFAFAFSPAFFDWTVAPEVYSGQILTLFIVLALALELKGRGGKDSADRRYLFLAGFVMGLSCGMHMGMVLLAPGLAFLLLVPNRSLWKPAHIAFFGFFILLGFSVFLLLPIRSATPLPFDQGNPEQWGNFLAHITGRSYSEIIHSFPLPRILHNLRALAAHIPDQLTWPVALFALVGLAALLSRHRLILAGLALITAGHLYLYIKDWDRAFGYIPIFALAALLAGLGLIVTLAALGKRGEKAQAAGILIGAVAAFALLLVQSHQALATRSHADHDLAHRHARALMDSMPQDALYISYQDANSYTVFYMQTVEAYREDLIHIQRAFLPHTDYLRERYPELDWSRYRPKEPGNLHAWLLRSRKAHPPYWDYGWEEEDYLPLGSLVPAGFVFRVTGAQDEAKAEIDFQHYFGRVLAGMADFPYDFTVREVYARRFSLLAKHFFDQENFMGAEDAIRRAIGIRPRYGGHFAQLAAVLARMGQKEKAYGNAIVATELEPIMPENWNYRAQFAQALGKRNDARHSYEKSLALNRYQSTPASALAEILVNAGDYASARLRGQDAQAAAESPEERTRAGRVLAGAWIGLGACPKAIDILVELLAENPKDDHARRLHDYCQRTLGEGRD